MPGEYRSRTRILLDVLRAVRDEGDRGITRVLYRSNLSHDRLTEYLEEAEGKGWIQEEEQGTRRTFQLTDEGVEVVRELARIQRSMEDFGLEL